MNIALGVAGPALTLVSWIAYMAAIARERVPPRPVGHIALQAAAIVASLAALAVATQGGLVGPIVGAAITLPMAGLFLFLLTQAPVPDTKIRVDVGGPMLAFTAHTSAGVPWSSTSLAGQRVLLKFFRGGW